MNQIQRINAMMDSEPDRYKRMSMAAVLRDTLRRIERLRSKGEAK